MVGKLFGSTGEEGKKRWKKLHNEEIHDLNTPRVLLGDNINKYEKKAAYATYGGENISIGVFFRFFSDRAS